MASPSPSVSPDLSDFPFLSPPSLSPPLDSSISPSSPTNSTPSQNAEPPSTPSTPSPPPPSDTSPPPPVAVSASPPLPSPPPPAVTAAPLTPAIPPSSPAADSPPPPSPPPPLPKSPSPPTSTLSPPPSPPQPPSKTSPPPPAEVSPPPVTSPPPPDISPPPPPSDSPPPQSDPTPPPSTSSPPPPHRNSHPPPPPKSVSPTPSSISPPPPAGESPELSPPSPELSPPPPDPAAPPSSTLSSPPPPLVPSTFSPPPPPPPPFSVPSSPTNGSGETPGTSPTRFVGPDQPITTGNNTRSTAVKGDSSNGTAVAVGSVIGVVVLSLVIMVAWFVQKRKRRRKNIPYTMPSPFSSQNSDSIFIRPHSSVPLVGSRSDSDFKYSSSEGGAVGNSRWFSYEELLQATGGFSSKNLLGEGGFGCVYKGNLSDGREVAVKQLKIGGGQGEREFRAEVEIISRVHHRHLVSLVGYCISDHQRLLVYDYVPNNTLHYHLHDQNRPVLPWATRVQIAAGAARGIAYLHEDCHPRIIHRDIKSSNILLDKNFEAQVADFGLAKLALDSHTHVTTRVMGTFGYMAPEYATSGKLTDKSDVYSYGVVLLELITGRKPVDSSQPLGDESLVEWARPLLSQAIEDENFEELVDPRLDGNYVDREVFRMIEAAAACVRHSAVKRPRMSQVVRALDSLDEQSDLANGVKPGQSEVFNSAEHSAQIRMFQRMAFGSQDCSFNYFDQSRSQSSWSRESRDQSPSAPINRSRPWNN